MRERVKLVKKDNDLNEVRGNFKKMISSMKSFTSNILDNE